MKYFLIHKAHERVLEKRGEENNEIQSGFYIFITKTKCQEDGELYMHHNVSDLQYEMGLL